MPSGNIAIYTHDTEEIMKKFIDVTKTVLEHIYPLHAKFLSLSHSYHPT